jgi:hypothetical protein
VGERQVHQLLEAVFEERPPVPQADHLFPGDSEQLLRHLVEDRYDTVCISGDDAVEGVVDQPLLEVIGLDQIPAGALEHRGHMLEGVRELDDLIAAVKLVDFTFPATLEFLRES